MTYTTIANLTAREPVYAVVRIGAPKSQTGTRGKRQPWGFTFVAPNKDASGDRPAHPAFYAYNRLPPEQRRQLRGRLVHDTRTPNDESPGASLQKHACRALGPGWEQWPGAPPSGLWACEGDGVEARRIFGVGEDGVEDWRPIPCPGRLCEFSMEQPDGSAPPCRIYTELLFLVEWGDWQPKDGKRPPEVLCRFASRGANTAARLKGFFEDIEHHVKHWYPDGEVSLYNLPFVMALLERSKPPKKKWAEVSFALEGSLARAFAKQHEELKLAGVDTMRYLGAGDEPDEEASSAKEIEGPVEIDVPNEQGGLF